MTAILLGLLASLGWGVANFYGGIASRRWPPIFITFYSYVFELLILLGLMLLRGRGLEFGGDFYWAMAAGALAVVSISRFFRLLASGNMALTAPLVALTYAIVPVIYGFISIGWPKNTQLAGIAFALVAIPVLAQGSENIAVGNVFRQSLRLVGEPILYGIGFGLVLIFINQITETELLATLIVARSTGSPLLLLILLLSPGARQALKPAAGLFGVMLRPALVYALVIGIGDIIAYGAFIFSAQLGGITIAAVLSSLPPAVTVLMARFIDQEQPSRAQLIGLALSLLAIVLISL